MMYNRLRYDLLIMLLIFSHIRGSAARWSGGSEEWMPAGFFSAALIIQFQKKSRSVEKKWSKLQTQICFIVS